MEPAEETDEEGRMDDGSPSGHESHGEERPRIQFQLQFQSLPLTPWTCEIEN